VSNQTDDLATLRTEIALLKAEAEHLERRIGVLEGNQSKGVWAILALAAKSVADLLSGNAS